MIHGSPNSAPAVALDETHAASLESWVESANDAATDFPIQNLPFGRFRCTEDAPWRIGVAIGDQVLDLESVGLIDTQDMNRLMAAGAATRCALRLALSRALRRGHEQRARFEAGLRALSEIEMGLPCQIGDYTDFYTGIHHATAVGKMFRPDSPLMPNYKWVPIGYHGRASSIGVSGQSFRRPLGQTQGHGETTPVLGPSRRLDYELELAAFVAVQNQLGDPVSIALEVLLQTERMRAAGEAPVRLSATDMARAAYWTPAQLVAHHTVNGCNLQPGDLMGSGTLSGPGEGEAGSLMEITGGGKRPLLLANGEQRTFLEDGDTLVLRGWCEREGAVRIGLGEARGTVLPPA